jgi:hypothetical protein
MRLTQKSWWRAVLVGGGLATTSVVMVRAAPLPVCQPSSVCPPGYTISVNSSTTNGPIIAVALCPSPMLVMGGGFYSYSITDAALNVTVINSYPLTNYGGGGSNGWEADFQSGSETVTVYVYAICFDPSILSTVRSGGARQ